MTTRHAHTTWDADLEGGSGRIELTSSRKEIFPVTFTGRTGRDPDGTTGPEELLAAAHGIDYAMRLATVVAEEGGIPVRIDVDTAVDLGPAPDGGFRITRIALGVRGEVGRLDIHAFERAVRTAHETYPLGRTSTDPRSTVSIVGEVTA